MVRVFGIGIGLFLMSILWPTALIFYMISRKAKPHVTYEIYEYIYIFLILSFLLYLIIFYSNFGFISIAVMTVLTIILILIPKQSDIRDEMIETSDRAPDLMSLFRPLIITINIIALLFGFTIIYNKYICKQITRYEQGMFQIYNINASYITNYMSFAFEIHLLKDRI